MAENTQIQKIAPGEILQLQGEKISGFYMLVSGKLDVLIASSEYVGLDSSIILEHSSRVGSFEGKSYVVAAEGYTLRAVTECQLQKYSVATGNVKFLAKQNPVHSINVLIQLFKRMEKSLSDVNNFVKLYKNISYLSDNMGVLSQELSAQEVPENLYDRVIENYEAFKTNGGEVPAEVDGKFLIQDNGKLLEKDYGTSLVDTTSIFDKNEYLFLKRFLHLDKKIFSAVVKSDPVIADHFSRTVKSNIGKIYNTIIEIQKKVETEMDLLFGPSQSWVDYLIKQDGYSEWKNSGKLSSDFLNHLVTLSSKIYTMYGELLGTNPSEQYSGLDNIVKYSKERAELEKTMAASSDSSQTNSGEGGAKSNISRLYEKSIHQIFEFTLADTELQQNLIARLNEFKSLKNPFNTDSEGRKLRRQITKLYWDLYAQAFIRSRTVSNVPAPVKLMLRFGLLDETLLDEGQIESYHKIYNDSFQQGEVPVLHEPEFLEKIYKGEEEPSLNEMGLTYAKFLAEQNKTRIRKDDVNDDLNDPDKKVLYEINNMLTSTSGICSGSHATAFPILNGHQIKGDPDKFYVSKKKLTEAVERLKGIDYSAYYRETVLKLENAREIIEEEVIPNFILLPSIGVKTMMWQDLVGVNKRSPGRIVVPSFYVGDLAKSIAHSVAVFRWELNRTMKSSMWADPVEGGLTGFYFDYVSFYKKNPKLSLEAKEKIGERFKACRNNPRELFADDYIMWVLYEKDGIMKMNNVVRDIFYRYVPFPEKLRNRLEKMPAFSDSANRFKNIRNRTVASSERKFKKYRDEDEKLPVVMQKYLDYLKM